jgi:phage baseplate assembly protein W
MSELPFFGKGVGFPFRINTTKKGVELTVGNTDATSVALEYLMENWSIREELRPKINHIAESIAHILLTRMGEHDTLPEFGSNLYFILFENITKETMLAAEAHFKFSTIRWEKRAKIPQQFYFDAYNPVDATPHGGVRWHVTGAEVDKNLLPVWVYIQFIIQQEAGNLVVPFVTARQARIQEYPSGAIDLAKHDQYSRYYQSDLYYKDNIRFSRPRIPRFMRPSTGDRYHTVIKGDTWLLLSWKYYSDIRFWYHIAISYVFDQAMAGAPSSTLDTTGNPPISSTIRIPDKKRVLLSIYT